MTRRGAQPEQRAFGRRESRIHAFVHIPGRRPEACVVRNYSEGGALLAFSVPFEPPSRFRLTIEAKGLDVMCEIRRHTGQEFGVEFVKEAAEGVPVKMADLMKTPDEPTPETAQNVLGSGGLILVMPAEELRRQLVV